MINIVPDPFYLVIMMGIFLLAALILARLIFAPILGTLDERIRRTTGLAEEVTNLEGECEKRTQTYAEGLARARAQGLRLRHGLKAEAFAEHRTILDEARRASEAVLAQIRERMVQEAKEARLTLRQHAQQISRQIVAKVLGQGLV